jgi:hypothetical protein
MAKASLKQLDELHNAVAKQLADNLDDPKTLAQAITFLKNNNITVDLQESKEVQNIFTTVNNLVKDSKDLKKDSVDSLLDEIAY